MSNQTTFSARLEALLEERGISKADLAKSLHVDRKTIYRLTNNTESDPKLTVLLAVADFFSVSIDYLAGRTNNRDQIIARTSTEQTRPRFFNKRWEE